MATLIGILLLGLATILQTTIVILTPMLEGPADLVLLILIGWTLQNQQKIDWPWGVVAGLMVGIASALPIWVPIIAYVLVTFITQWLQNRVWRVQILSLFTVTFFGTFLVHGTYFLYLVLIGTPLSPQEAFNLVILPSAVLNILLALPIYGLIGEITLRIFPEEEQE